MRALLALVTSCCLGACASFEYGELPLLERWPPPAAAAPPVLRLEIVGMPDKFVDGWRAETVQELEASGRFAAVVTDAAAGAGRTLRLEVTHSRPDIAATRAFMYACALTLLVFPARAANTFELRAVVLDQAGAELGVVERSVTTVTWVGWVFLLALPFAGAGMTPLVEDSTRSIVLEAVDAGWL